jgi:hypothetical protein
MRYDPLSPPPFPPPPSLSLSLSLSPPTHPHPPSLSFPLSLFNTHSFPILGGEGKERKGENVQLAQT